MTAAPATQPSAAGQVFAFLGGMAAYAVHLLLSPALVPLACGWGATWPLHLLTAASLAVIAGAGVLAWRHWRGTSDGVHGMAGAGASRWRFVGLAGLMLNALAFTVVVFAEIPNHFLDPCLP